MLGFIERQFGCRILHLMRHPCAVVHSRLAVRRPWFADVEDILGQRDLVDEHLSSFVKDIEQERDILGAHAVWWAVENAVAIRQLEGRPHLRVYYEDVALQPEKAAARILIWLTGNEPSAEVVARIAALSTRPSRVSRHEKSLPAMERLSEWQRKLSQEEQGRILSWAARLGVSCYGPGLLPSMVEPAQEKRE